MLSQWAEREREKSLCLCLPQSFNQINYRGGGGKREELERENKCNTHTSLCVTSIRRYFCVDNAPVKVCAWEDSESECIFFIEYALPLPSNEFTCVSLLLITQCTVSAVIHLYIFLFSSLLSLSHTLSIFEWNTLLSPFPLLLSPVISHASRTSSSPSHCEHESECVQHFMHAYDFLESVKTCHKWMKEKNAPHTHTHRFIVSSDWCVLSEGEKTWIWEVREELCK